MKYKLEERAFSKEEKNFKQFSKESIKISKLDFFDLEDDIIGKIPKGKLYHGSNDISWFSGIGDIDVENNTSNAKSKYLFLSPRIETALNYSIDSVGMKNIIHRNSGILVFDINGKYKKLKSTEFKDVKDINDVELIYDKYKKMGYDYVTNTSDGDNYVVLNNDALTYLGGFYNMDGIKN